MGLLQASVTVIVSSAVDLLLVEVVVADQVPQHRWG
jgi:hypothetical protein